MYYNEKSGFHDYDGPIRNSRHGLGRVWTMYEDV
jgi:hypothetical protein